MKTPAALDDTVHSFRATLYRVGLIRHVDVPEAVTRALGGAARIAVRAWIEGTEVQTTLVARGRGRHRLAVHSGIWRRLGLDVGDAVEVELMHDPDAGEAPPPPDLAAALEKSAKARAAFAKQTAAFRRQIGTFIEQSRSATVRARRVAALVERLAAGDPRKKPDGSAAAKRSHARRPKTS